jgi:hypothetical protein
MPVALVLKYTVAKEAVFSIAISERFKYLQNWRQGEKASKVIILRDIHTQNTHAGHTRILQDLVKPVGVSTYEQLHQHWLQVLDVSILNKKFFQDLSNWYFSAMNEVSFPDDLQKKKEVRNATNLIRLITRVIFIWFIKEKQLVPASLFRKDFVASILKDFNKNKKSQNYYNAILQNLFFGTLNQKMEERKFAKEGDIRTNKEEYGVKNLFRYADLFNIPEKEVLALFKDVPFLNGGLFDCLDKPNDDGKIEYVDGFSRNAKKQASVPDYIFFGEEKEVDLNEVYGTKNKRYSSRGLINLLESYKFTVAENTPIEEEIALDPELLGKVFENLLASYNPETQTTARKQTGSFYTPREIVNYMVDESLLEYIKQNVKNDSKDFETRLRDVFSYSENPNPFSEAETKDLIDAINNCKILDPACGSGAFPMGILHKMVHILQKLDPENKHWKDLQRKKAIEQTEAAFNIGDKEERAKRLAEINDVFENNASDYGRKLYLIENCIYGIDIQPIAVQIAKLRFFISLVIDQKVNKSKENFGVRSLPNLETKFVAANTLIGLDKPKQLPFRNPDIEVKENELKELRHKYFTANTRKQKIALQKQDKKLRLEIAKMLENDGWETKVAKQIIAFDPYDQNIYANWFDPEWMYGLNEGFDIIIGNPPYISYYSGQAAEISPSDYKTYIEHYDFIENKKAKNRLGTLFFFLEKTYKILKHGSNSTFIIDINIFSDAYIPIRKYLHNKVSVNFMITNLSEFENVGSGQIIFSFNKGFTKSNRFKVYSEFKDENPLLIDQSKVNDKNNYSLKFSSKEGLIEQINSDSVPIVQISNIISGMNIGGVKDYFLSETKKDKTYHKAILSGNIFRYEIKYPNEVQERNPRNKFIRFDKEIEKYIWDNKLGTPSIGENDSKFRRNKILLRRPLTGDGKLAAAYSEDKDHYSDVTVYIINEKDVPLKYLLGIINSKLASYYCKETGIIRAEKGQQPQITINRFKEFPIKISSNPNSIIRIVEYILFLKNNLNDTSFFERLIDGLVYELYLPELMVSNGVSVLKFVGELPVLKIDERDKNLKVIEKISKELKAPNHPINASLLKLLTIEEINIIEGRK